MTSVTLARRVAMDVEGDRAGGGSPYPHGDWLGPTVRWRRGGGPESPAAGTAGFDGPDVDAGAGMASALDMSGGDAGATGMGVCAVEPARGDGADRGAVGGGDADSDGGGVSAALEPHPATTAQARLGTTTGRGAAVAGGDLSGDFSPREGGKGAD